jgi:hypothetical protein
MDKSTTRLLRCRLTLILVSVFLICVSWFDCQCLAQEDPRIATEKEKSELFSLIEKLEKSIPFKHEAVSELSGRKLQLDTNIKPIEPGEVISEFCTPTNNNQLVSKISVTETDELTKGLGGLASLEVNPDFAYVTPEQIEKHFGQEVSLNKSPLLDIPADMQPWDYVYKRYWGKLVFRVRSEAPHALTKIVLYAWQKQQGLSAER